MLLQQSRPHPAPDVDMGTTVAQASAGGAAAARDAAAGTMDASVAAVLRAALLKDLQSGPQLGLDQEPDAAQVGR